MHILDVQRKARMASVSAVEQFRAEGLKAAGMSGSGITVGDYGMFTGVHFGKNQQNEREYSHYRGWTYAACRPIATTIAAQPVRVAVRPKLSKKPGLMGGGYPKRTYKASLLGDRVPTWVKAAGHDLNIYEDHPVLHVIDRPNEVMTKWHLMFTSALSLQLTGKSHWWLTVDSKTDEAQIWPLPSSWIQPKHTKEKAFEKWIVIPGGNGAPIEIPPEEIVYFYYPDPAHPLQVQAPLGAAARAIVSDEAISDAQCRSFRQGIWPGLAVIAGDYIDDEGEGGRPLLEREQREQIYLAIRRAWGGVMNMNEPLILDALIKDVKKLTNSPEEMAFMDSARMTKAQVMQIFGTNPAVNGEIEGLNRATAISARYQFADFTVNPIIQLMSETLTQTIGVAMSKDDEDLVVWIEPYKPDDQDGRRSNFQSAAQAGVKIRQNEYRTQVCNLPPLTEEEGGEEFITPTGKGGNEPGALTPAGQIGEAAKPTVEEVTPTTDGEAADAAMAADASAGKMKLLPGKKGLKVQATPAQKAFWKQHKSWREDVFLKSHSKSESRLAAVCRTMFAEQRVDVMKEMVKAIKANGTDGFTAATLVNRIFDAKAWDKRFRQGLKSELLRVMARGAITEVASVKIREKGIKAPTTYADVIMDLPPDIAARVRDALDELIDADFWSDVQDTTKAALTQSIAEGLENHESLYELACRIGDDPTTDAGLENPGIFEPDEEFGYNPVLGNGPSTRRALLIARTETTGALNAGHKAALDGLEEDGLIAGHMWSAILDNHTRDSHIDADEEYGEGNPVSGGQKFVLHGVDGDVECDYPGDMDLPPSERCNCLLPGNEVSGAFVAAMRSRYSGEAVEIVLRSGRRFSVTPNHPVLTPHGLIGAGSLNQGDQIVAYNRQVEVAPDAVPCSDQVDDKPSTVDDVFETLRLRGAMGAGDAIERISPLAADFHGDEFGIDGEIEIVWADVQLMEHVDVEKTQVISDSEFSIANEDLTSESASRPTLVCEGVRWAEGQDNGGSNTGFGSPSARTLTLDKPAILFDRRPLNALRIGLAAKFDVRLSEHAKQSASRVSRFVRDTLERFPGDVLLDEVVEIRHFEFSGHVYDLQSLSGLIVANGAILSNCRCLIQSVFADEMADAEAAAFAPQTKDWEEGKHPRGQPGNAGQFGSGGGGAKDDATETESEVKPDAHQSDDRGTTKPGSPFDASKWSGMPMGDRRTAWAKMPEEERDLQADAATSIPARKEELMKGVAPRPDTGDLKKDVTTRLSQMEDRVHPQAIHRIETMCHDYADALEAMNVSPALARSLTMEAVDMVAAQEMESMGRSLGDHGAAHIQGDIQMACDVLSAAGKLTPMNKALVSTAMLFHDAGYMTEPGQVFLDEGHHRWSAEYYAEHLRGTVQTALGRSAAAKVEHIITTHDSREMDWEHDPVTAACRLGDNLAVFHKEKLPGMFRYVPGNLEVFEQWAQQKISFDEAKKQAAANIDKAKVPDKIRDQLKSACNELADRGASDAMGMLGGYVADVGWIVTDNAPAVRLNESPINTRVNKIGDFGQRQFAKLATTFAQDPKKFATDLSFEFRDSDGKLVLKAVWEKVKEWLAFLRKHCGG